MTQKPEFDVIILGAGPAGLFAAYELTKLQPNLKVLIIERGNSIETRKPGETVCGVGGSGTFSDGKLHFTPVLSHEKLLDIFTIAEYQQQINYVDQLFTDFGVTSAYTPDNMEEAEELVKNCQRQGIHLYIRKCRHVGTDFLPKVIANMVKILEEKGVKILCNTKVEEILTKNQTVIGLKTEDKVYGASKYLIAPGRIGTSWLQKQAVKIGLHYSYQKVEIGVRVEFPASIMEEHSDILHENIYSIKTPTFDDTVRNFCPCPYGYVAVEDYGDYVCVNGHSNSQKRSPNSNFDLTTEVQLTEPVENTTDYAIEIAKITTTIGGGKPLIQRLTDLKSGRRSTWSRINKSFTQPTLKEATPGDIAMALPYRVVKNLLEGLEILDRVLPGLNNSSTLLYAPEVKLRGNRIKINRNMQTEIPNLYVAGDGAGTSGNIVGAAISGIFAAKGILS
ncbi:hypothetical protein A2X44_00800 [candidate division CPR3 bacterium GWF2_35_18]|nr:MAG: hypothetical protein A2X44_00800 [candidate division CPR3 bacterium GWF2_35_18]OGB64894.1 MAG: hypothetical protein A2250_05225 [candidate division CPR3 bacterium RIFOXYA2_FULL_35_13]OGB75826.1 MAG: hypothetical protein A2476_05765 [candidate division CPR3 bacterium RIFOXYC2_FULL_35_7]OGB78588.1 MAG: hypothetical protein A2296_01405 [candidate division CPR3 bacterium RIFOXYB2_FULL_35_8]OGB79944.1 MAG: hypothetical protein A2011_03040 [candidate division CPR3 bacterium GWE2_35_7]